MVDLIQVVRHAPEASRLYEGGYDPALVITSLVVAVVAAYVGLLIARRIAVEPDFRRRRLWQGVGGVVVGVGIWSMHFIAMLAWQLPCSVTYDLWGTAASILPAMLASVYTIGLLSRASLDRLHWWMGGLIMGGGIGLMHYLGMAAYQIEGEIQYDLFWFALSLFVAVALALLALGSPFRVQAGETERWTSWPVLISALLMGLAVSGMHYTAMEATYFVRVEGVPEDLAALSPELMSGLVLAVVGSLMILVLLLLSLNSLAIVSLVRPFGPASLAMVGWIFLAWLIAHNYTARQRASAWEDERAITRALLVRLNTDFSDRLETLDNLAGLLSRLGSTRRFLAAREAPGESRQREVDDWFRGASNSMHARIWLVDQAGLCVAHCTGLVEAGRVAGSDYFQSAREGRLGHHYDAAGERMLHAYPAMEGKRMLGAVIVDYDLSGFAEVMRGSDTLLIDQRGVILLAGDPRWTMHVLPGESATRMSPEALRRHYGRESLSLFSPMRFVHYPETDGEAPLITDQMSVPHHGLTMWSYRLVSRLQKIVDRELALFVMLALVGDMLILSVAVIVIHLRVLRREKRAAQESEARVTRSHDRLAVEQLRLRKILDFAPVPMAYAEPDGTILHQSRTFTALLGYEPGEIPNVDTWFVRVYPDPRYRQQVRVAWETRISQARSREGEVAPAVYRIRDKGGEFHDCEVQGVTFPDGASVVTLVDLTERLRIEQALRDSESRYRTLFENSHDAILLYAADGQGFRDCNAKALALLGLESKEALLSRQPADFTPPRQANGQKSRRLIESYIRRALSGESLRFEWLLRTQQGDDFPVDILLSLIIFSGDMLIQATMRDITELKAAQERLKHLANHDPLTGLPNRRLFSEHLQQALALAERNQSGLALLFIDLDKFKPINDDHGHADGDVVLREVAERIRLCLRKSDVVGRIGGDEFVALLNDSGGSDDVGQVAEKIRLTLERPFRVEAHTLTISGCIGIACYPDDGREATELTRHADEAMYQAKQAGGNRIRFYRAEPSVTPGSRTQGATRAQAVQRTVANLSTPPAPIEFFPWNENFDTGLPVIDTQHRQLVEILNQLANQVAFESATDSPEVILEALVDYTLYHFETEEALWHQCLMGDEEEISHRQIHVRFVDRIAQIKTQSASGDAASVVRDLLSFLVGWLASHILGPDRYLAQVCLAMGEGCSHEEAKSRAHQKMQGTSQQLIEIILSNYQSLTANTVRLIAEIAEHRRMEHALRLANEAQQDSLARIQLLFESSQDGVIEMDDRGRVTGWNRQSERIFGYSKAQAMGCELANLVVPPTQREAHRRGVSRMKSTTHSEMLGKRLEVTGMRADGSEFPLELTVAALSREQGYRFTAYVRDLSEYKVTQARVDRLQTHDSLTRLPNRRLLADRLELAISACQRHGRRGALLLLDIICFKAINESMGHDRGDQMLEQVAERLQQGVPEAGTIARTSGDEFAVLIDELQDDAQAECLGRKVLTLIGAPFRVVDHDYSITVKLGGVLFGETLIKAGDLLRQADIALFHAKQDKESDLRFYHSGMQAIYVQRALLESDLRQALEQGQFELLYQRKVDHQRRTIGAEALLRWHHPRRGLLAPLEFIGLAEECGLIRPIGRWVLDAACAQLGRWLTSPETRSFRIAVNVSAQQFHSPDFVEYVERTLQRHAVDGARLVLELTENLVLEGSAETLFKMDALHDLGVRFAMDDFGTGFSSLAYLTQLPLHQLKIDQSFVRHIGRRRTDDIVVRTIIGMAAEMELEVIAEGVETEAQFEFLVAAGCRLFQGYLFGRPSLAEEIR